MCTLSFFNKATSETQSSARYGDKMLTRTDSLGFTSVSIISMIVLGLISYLALDGAFDSQVEPDVDYLQETHGNRFLLTCDSLLMDMNLGDDQKFNVSPVCSCFISI